MPDYVVERVAEALNTVRKPINGSRVHLFGVAYKTDVNDMRESPALDVLELLSKRGARLSYTDPYVPELRHGGHTLSSIDLAAALAAAPDCAVICTDHGGVRLRRAAQERHVDRRHAQRAQEPFVAAHLPSLRIGYTPAVHSWLPDLLVCPECGGALSLDGANWKGDEIVAGTLSCGAGHRYPIVGGVPRFVQHELDADQARSRDSFGYEWTRLYPEHGHQTAERQAERDIFLEYTRTVPSDYRNKLVLDAGCGNGRYAKLANDWGARVVAVDISSAVEIAQRNVGIRADVAVVQADLFKLPFRPGTFEVVYSVGVLHHTPDAKGAFERIQPLVKSGGIFSLFIHGQGNRVLYATNRWLRAWTAKASYKTHMAVLPGANGVRQVAREDPVCRSRGVSRGAPDPLLLAGSAQQLRSLQRGLHELSPQGGDPRVVCRVGGRGGPVLRCGVGEHLRARSAPAGYRAQRSINERSVGSCVALNVQIVNDGLTS